MYTTLDSDDKNQKVSLDKPNVEIRDMNYEDEGELRSVAKLYASVPLEWDHSFQVTDTDSNYQWLLDKRDSLKCLVAAEGEKIVGIHILQKQAQRPKACFIKTLWVAATHRNLGIATSLKTKGESWAKITGSESIVTNVTVKNPKMLELNKRRGFAPTTIEMEKRLV